MNYLEKIITAFELHDVQGIIDCFENGIDPNAIEKGKPLIFELINMYSRGPLFAACIKTFVDFGVEIEDKVLLAVLMNDAISLDKLLLQNPGALDVKYTFDCTFTPMLEASLLHICAEYNHLDCARVLVKYGADINAKAGIDENGFGGHTPIFHCVNQHANGSIDVLRYLISLKVDLSVTVKGLIWGQGYDWETFVPSVNPISYAMMGLLRQFQRTEKDIYEVVSMLMKEKYQMDYFPGNIPNKYLYN
ncbi:ankyrin repeat domain-containing protein [Lacihabitans soyangensis]|uniref:Ankyrin repeat domain-containing protein n=1 Tax=Lacihabitans soyangensis TaxID=869394 RepID=A0AAE3KT19_9BACT|nr:ankyrin repeat domain-containing protein [Lacihabitans soyangensis]MCP9763658.1 ankyrin repeat domain-containing protein [Lacihabitans soyangensis]